MTNSISAHTVPSAKDIWTSNGFPESFLARLRFTGNPDTAVPSSFRLGLAAQISAGLAGLSAAYIHYLRTGIEQDVTIDARHAVLSFHSEAWYSVDGRIPPGDLWDSIAGLYRTKDDSWVHIHTNFPHHRQGVLSVLGLSDTPSPVTRAQVAEAIMSWDGLKFEEECGKRSMCVFRLRRREEWEATPQGRALHGVKVVDIRKVDEADKLELRTDGKRSHDGVRILDLSRVLAGPVAGRTLAAQGAEVLFITSPNLPSLPRLDIETSLGKRTTQLDLNAPEDIRKLQALTRDATVFMQAYRPEGLASRGFSVKDVIDLKTPYRNSRDGKGIVYTSLRAWGWEGPWADRRGFDSLVQTATGFNADEADAFQVFLASQGKQSTSWAPKPFPMQAIDHTAGYFLAFGINVALARMLSEGGSHEVRVSLASVGNWIRSLGRLDPHTAFGPHAKPFPPRAWPLNEEIASLSTMWVERRGSGWKKDYNEGTNRSGNKFEQRNRRTMTALRQAAVLSATPVREGTLGQENDRKDSADDWGAPMELNLDVPIWLHTL